VKAIRVHELGGPEVLRYEDIPTPELQEGQVLIKIEAAGVNYLDSYYRSGFHWGGHYQCPLPFTPGAEGAGTVVAVGPRVSEVDIGDRVAFGISNGQGSYAEMAVVPSWHLVKLPSHIDFLTGAAVMLQGMTAHYLTQSTYPVKPTDTVLIHAAAGGTGLLLIQMVKLCGARVIGTVSTPEKARFAKMAGADEIIIYTVQDFEAEVKRLTEGRGVTVIYDSVGKETFKKSLNSLAPRGYLVIFGQASGPVPCFDTAVLNSKGSLFLARPSLGHYVTNRNDILSRSGDLLRWIEAGRLNVYIGKTFALADAGEAHRLLSMRESIGKLLLIP